jgi:hypothetical protein
MDEDVCLGIEGSDSRPWAERTHWFSVTRSFSPVALYAVQMPLNASENCLLMLAMVAMVAIVMVAEEKCVILMVAVAVATIGAISDKRWRGRR